MVSGMFADSSAVGSSVVSNRVLLGVIADVQSLSVVLFQGHVE